jgi:hypothetical protein
VDCCRACSGVLASDEWSSQCIFCVTYGVSVLYHEEGATIAAPAASARAAKLQVRGRGGASSAGALLLSQNSHRAVHKLHPAAIPICRQYLHCDERRDRTADGSSRVECHSSLPPRAEASTPAPTTQQHGIRIVDIGFCVSFQPSGDMEAAGGGSTASGVSVLQRCAGRRTGAPPPPPQPAAAPQQQQQQQQQQAPRARTAAGVLGRRWRRGREAASRPRPAAQRRRDQTHGSSPPP